MNIAKQASILLITAVLLNEPAISQQKSGFIFQPSASNFIIYNRQGSNVYLHHNKLVQWKILGNIRKLSSAKRITRAGDDPSGLAVAEKMKTLLNQMRRESMNLQDYRNYLRYYDGMIAQNHDLLKRIRLIILRSSSGILGPDDREINQSEIDQLLRQIDMNARFSTFNTKQAIPSLTVKNLGLEKVNVVKNLYGSMKLVDDAANRLLRLRARGGAASNVLTFRIKGKSLYYINLQKAESGISDLDMASEISNLIKNSIILKSQYGIIIKSGK